MRTAWHIGGSQQHHLLCEYIMSQQNAHWCNLTEKELVLHSIFQWSAIKRQKMTKHFFFFFFFRNRSCVNWYSYKVPKGAPFLKSNLFRRITNEQKYMAQSGLILLNHLRKGNDHSIFNETIGVLSHIQVLYQTGIVNQRTCYSA